jgi:hypothetical protein
VCGCSESCGNTRPGRTGPRIRPRDPARLEALWAVSSGPPNPRHVGAALAGEVNLGASTCVSLLVNRRARPRTSCRAAGTARWCLFGDKERQRLGETVKALPVESCPWRNQERHDAEGQRSVRGSTSGRATTWQCFGKAGDLAELRRCRKPGGVGVVRGTWQCFGKAGDLAELRRCWKPGGASARLETVANDPPPSPSPKLAMVNHHANRSWPEQRELCGPLADSTFGSMIPLS